MKHLILVQGLLGALLSCCAVPQGILYAQTLSVVQDAALTNGLVSYWPLDEYSGVRVDMRGDNDLSDHGAVGFADGIQHAAADFEAENTNALSIADAVQSGLDLGANGTDFTASMWAKPEITPSTWLTLFNKWDDSEQRGLVAVIESATSIKVVVSQSVSGPWVNKVLSGTPSLLPL